MFSDLRDKRNAHEMRCRKKLRSTDIVYSSSLFFILYIPATIFMSPLMSTMMLLTKKMIQFNDNDDESGVYIFSENCS